MPKYVHPHDRERRTGKNVASRLDVITAKLSILIDKEWDALEVEDYERLSAIRLDLDTMIGKYRR